MAFEQLMAESMKKQEKEKPAKDAKDKKQSHKPFGGRQSASEKGNVPTPASTKP